MMTYYYECLDELRAAPLKHREHRACIYGRALGYIYAQQEAGKITMTQAISLTSEATEVFMSKSVESEEATA